MSSSGVNLATQFNFCAKHLLSIKKRAKEGEKGVLFIKTPYSTCYMHILNTENLILFIVAFTRFGEKEEGYKKLDYSRMLKVASKSFGRHAPQSDACCCCYHNAVCLSVKTYCILKRDLHAYHWILCERRHLQERSGTSPVDKQTHEDLSENIREASLQVKWWLDSPTFPWWFRVIHAGD